MERSKDDADGLLVENMRSSGVNARPAGSATMPSHTTRSSKPQVRYLLDSRLSAEMPRAKLPKNKHVLWRFLEFGAAQCLDPEWRDCLETRFLTALAQSMAG